MYPFVVVTAATCCMLTAVSRLSVSSYCLKFVITKIQPTTCATVISRPLPYGLKSATSIMLLTPTTTVV